MARRSPRERNTAAIAHEPEPTGPDRHDAARPADPKPIDDTEPAPSPAKSASLRSKEASAGTSETARLGMYLTPQELENAKGAYLADWRNGGQADTFARWIAAALNTYAATTPQQRSTATPRGRAQSRTGLTRSFSIPTATMTRMRAAITADQSSGRWPSDSAWCAEAIAAAVETARTANGGTLPTPPPRLPNRLMR